jgi:hypothetical protein
MTLHVCMHAPIALATGVLGESSRMNWHPQHTPVPVVFSYSSAGRRPNDSPPEETLFEICPRTPTMIEIIRHVGFIFSNTN